jgi:predicted ATPase
MEAARIEHISIEGHTSIESARVGLGAVNILVGANGSGKSNFIRALELLGRIADQDLALYVERSGGASMLVRQPASPGIKISMDSGASGYQATLETTPDDRLIFAAEHWFALGRGASGGGSAAPGGRESKVAEAVAQATRVENVIPRNQQFSLAHFHIVFEMLSGCRVFHFHDTSSTAPVKQPSPTADNLKLAADARNLAAVLFALQQSDPVTYRRIVRAVQQVAPFLRDFVLREEGTDRIRLRWRQTDSDTVFSAHQMSDGTLRFICLATLLLQPNPPQLIVLDEPELGLHPYAIGQLAGMLKAASVDHQVVIATQSVTLIDQFALDDLIVVERERGRSVFHRPDPERLREWLDEYSLGELWQKNLIGGRPKRESA